MSKHQRKLDLLSQIMSLLREADCEVVEAATTLSGAYLQALSQFDSLDDALGHLSVTTKHMANSLNEYFKKHEQAD